MKNENVTVFWTWERGRTWANCSNGRRIATWSAEPEFACFVELLNGAPLIGAELLAAWLGFQ